MESNPPEDSMTVEVSAADALDQIKAIVGPKGIVSDPEQRHRYVEDWHGLYAGMAEMVVLPTSTSEVANVVGICAAARIPVFPQGGHTGLCGGAAPTENGRGIVLGLARMNRVRSVDPTNFTISVDAGCILADVQRAAEAADRYFPLSLGAEGTCQIGGNLSTNAGGTAVLRYGTMRDLTLGLEVVLPDGRIVDALRSVRKDNTGYDLRHLFVGAEGTLGVITAATLKLFPRPRQTETALLGLERLDDAMKLFARSRDASGDQLTGFELMSRFCIQMALDYTPGVRDPLSSPYPWYVLIEMTSSQAGTGLRAAIEQILEDAVTAGEVQDGVIAASSAQRGELWRVREAMIMGIRHQGPAVKHDVSVPVSQVARFITDADEAVLRTYPGSRTLAFGHVGDGNIHYNAFDVAKSEMPACQRMINDIVIGLGGSISAEHGIGLSKRDELTRYRSETELDVMRRIKLALDPAQIMNPGKVLRI
jgi:FAD/FMN-containing dehydrogenase